MVDTTNRQLVGVRAGRISVQAPASTMTADQALVHAAWLVALAEPVASEKFVEVLRAVKNT